MNLKVSYYQESEKDQVMNLICREYNYDLKEYAPFFAKFYEHPFQNNAHKITVSDIDADHKVVGFFALFYWPYQLNEKTYHAYKGVNAIVMPEYRGNGIFKKILDFVDENTKEFPIDFFIATPLPAAYYGFKKNKWKALLDLHWYIKPNNLFSLLFPLNTSKINAILPELKKDSLNQIKNNIHQVDLPDFINWRASFYKSKKYYLSYREGNNVVQFGGKINIRKKIIREFIIGEVSTNHFDPVFLANGLKHLRKEIKRIKCITFVSIAINPHNKIVLEAVERNNFSKIKKIIHIVVKDLTNCSEILNEKKWILYRADLDSW